MKCSNGLPEVINKEKIPYLDGLRGVSILIVIIGHLNIAYFHSSFIGAIFGEGGLGVIFFFVISGFLITTLLLKEKHFNGNVSLRKFYIRRIFRILPVAFLYILFLIICNQIFQLQIPSMYFIGAAFFVANIARFNSQPDPNGNSLLIAHYWSLSVEEQFYLFFPFLFKYFFRELIYILTFSILLISFFRFFNSHTYFYYHYESILVGCILALVIFKKKTRYFSLNKSSLILLSIFSIILGINYFLNQYADIIVSILFSLIIYLLISLEEKPFLFNFLQTKIMVKIGVLSYSLYIWQQVIISPSPIKKQLPWMNNIFIILFLLGLVSNISYYFFEKKFLTIKQHFK